MGNSYVDIEEVMSVTFANNNLLELDALAIMGVNVKVGSNPIGHFGTGLKFAVATLLRTGHKIEIWIAGKAHTLGLREKIIRGVTFQVVVLDGADLAYTTELGKNWETWKAYRELSCNAMDERDGYIGFGSVTPDEFETVIKVTGPEIDQVHENRRKYFCEAKLIERVGSIGEVREGPSTTIFFRGVAVFEMDKPMLNTYNILNTIALTEDRTMANTFLLPATIGKMIAGLTKYDVIARALLAKETHFERDAEYGSVTDHSEAFMAVVKKNANNWHANNSAKRYWQEAQPKEDPYKNITLDEIDAKVLIEAHQLAKVADMDYDLNLEDVRIVSYLGDGILGVVTDGQIFLSREVFTHGVLMVAGTLYEEWLHHERAMQDESRTMQNHLMNQLMKITDAFKHNIERKTRR